jgi:hypothetical protein
MPCLPALRAILVLSLATAGLAGSVAAEEKPRPKKPRILLVSKDNVYLKAFFGIDQVREKFQVQHLEPADLGDEKKYLKPAARGDFDLVIFDGCGPGKKAAMPRCNTFFIGQPPPPWKVGEVEKVKKPVAKTWMKEHALLADLTRLDEIGIVEAFRMKDLPKDAVRLIEADDKTPLLLSLKRKPHTDLVLTFALAKNKDDMNTNWVVRPSFVVFLMNVLENLGKPNEAPK